MNIGELAKFRGGIATDTISEQTSASGVTIDGTLIKDGGVSASGTVSVGTITEYASGSGVTIDETLIKDGGVTLKTGSEIQDAGGKYVKIKGGDGAAAAATGYVGEFKQSTIPLASRVNLSNQAANNVTSLQLGNGVWLVFGRVTYVRNEATVSNANCSPWINHTSASTTGYDLTVSDSENPFSNTYGSVTTHVTPFILRINSTTATLPDGSTWTLTNQTIYLNTWGSTFTGGPVQAYGRIEAIRLI